MLRFKRVGDEVRVYAGRKRVGTITGPGLKRIVGRMKYMEAMSAYALGFRHAKEA